MQTTHLENVFLERRSCELRSEPLRRVNRINILTRFDFAKAIRLACKYGIKAAGVLSISMLAVSAWAELPAFPTHSISPLYGRWRNAQGRAEEIMTIGPTWITTFHGDCPRRMRYRLVATDIENSVGQALLQITLKMHDAEFVGTKAKENCSDLDLANDYYLKISLLDEGQPSNSPILTFSWEACDTIEHLNEPVDAGHLNVRACGAGGGIMNRARKGH